MIPHVLGKCNNLPEDFGERAGLGDWELDEQMVCLSLKFCLVAAVFNTSVGRGYCGARAKLDLSRSVLVANEDTFRGFLGVDCRKLRTSVVTRPARV